MVEYTPHSRPSDDGRRTGPARSANAVRTGRATGPLTAIVILIVLGLAGFALWTTPEPVDPAAPAAGVSDTAAPSATAEPAPAPAPATNG
ncbi:hypothetical protein [Hoeflea sp.]|uniref:hypothetical protein n=1 Tax=Hoeflea sp. TaxID=1940281 RepID=UPI003BAE8F54